MKDNNGLLEKGFVWFVVSTTRNEIVSGHYHEDDAYESWYNQPNDGQYKVISHRWLMELYM